MHKFFAKTLFLGKNVVFLPQCHSTNELAKELAKKGQLPDGGIVWSDFQSKGKGQQGNVWLSEPGKNLLFTIYLKPDNLKVKDQFNLTRLISVAIAEVLADGLPGPVEIKWPNDIYVNDQKIAGILIETIISGNRIDEVFCGVGLNVNQSHFPLPTATSCSIIAEREFDRFGLLEQILKTVEKYYEGLFTGEQLKSKYLDNLRWLGEEHVYEADGERFNAVLGGVNEIGKVRLIVFDEPRYFDIKEVRFIE